MTNDTLLSGRDHNPDASDLRRAWRWLELPALNFLAPIWTGRLVGLAGPFRALSRASLSCGAQTRRVVRATLVQDEFEVILCLRPEAGDFFLAELGCFVSQIASNCQIAVLANRPPAAISQHFRHVEEFSVSTIAGGLIVRADVGRPRVAAIVEANANATPCLSLIVCSNAALPRLNTGIYRDNAMPKAASIMQAGVSTRSDGREGKVRLQITNSFKRALPQEARAVGLAERLLKVEDRTIELRRENMRLMSDLATEHRSGALAQGAIDLPKPTFSWPLANRSVSEVGALGLYDRRPDDVVLLESREGEAFLARHGLSTTNPNLAGVLRELREQDLTLRVASVEDDPDVSIIIPVYGQLPYTLNCLHSLFNHRSKYLVEIIVVDDCSPDDDTTSILPQVPHIRYCRQPRNGGFIVACNTGGDLARGRFILLLNNDTRVVSSWLDAILDSFRHLKRPGLVGSKMCYPDGSLQEAGGIIWRDGSAWNYGRNDDPNRPQYCHAREVDYISGCSIALPVELWRAMRGFDESFMPAYAEDADLCLRIAASGLSVWYQPQSRVIHYEGKTSGTSVGAGVKAYQVLNLKKLFLRWREDFETHRANGEAPFLERERKVRKRLLVIDAVTPTPNQDAGSLQTVLGMRCSRDSGYKVHFVPEDNWLFEPDYTPSLQREGVECSYAPFEVGFESYIRQFGWSFDVVIIYRMATFERVLDLLEKHAPQAVLVYHVADLHYLRAEREAQIEGSSVGLASSKKIKERELSLVQRADCTITHSTFERETLAFEVPEAPVVTWPLMMECAGTKVSFSERKDICFLGGYRHPPNVDAVMYFLSEVFPLIKAAQPQVRFIIAGANPTPEVEKLAREDVVVTGLVEDLRNVFDAVRVFVCPLRVGAGAKGKVLSALSYGVPVVSTPIGVEGAGLKTNEHVIVARTSEEMAKSVLKVYNDPELWRRLSEAGQDLVRDHFGLDMGRVKLAEVVELGYRHKLGIG